MFNKLAKRNAEFTVETISNGFVLTCGGRSADGDWINEKVHTKNTDELYGLIDKLLEMEQDD